MVGSFNSFYVLKNFSQINVNSEVYFHNIQFIKGVVKVDGGVYVGSEAFPLMLDNGYLSSRSLVTMTRVVG